MEKHLSSTWKPRLNISRLKIDRTRAMKFTLNFSVTLLLWACSMDVDDNLQSASTRWWRATSSRYLKTYETIKVPEWIQSNCSEFLRFWVWIPYQLSYRGRVDEKRPRIGLHNNYAFFFSEIFFKSEKFQWRWKWTFRDWFKYRIWLVETVEGVSWTDKEANKSKAKQCQTMFITRLKIAPMRNK